MHVHTCTYVIIINAQDSRCELSSKLFNLMHAPHCIAYHREKKTLPIAKTDNLGSQLPPSVSKFFVHSFI